MSIYYEPKKVIVFIDGENILNRYQAMMREGKIPQDNVIHAENKYLWTKQGVTYPERIGSQDLVFANYEIIRAYYYIHYSGDDTYEQGLHTSLKDISFWARNRYPQLTPKVFKKARRSTNVKGDDIDLTVTALHHAYNKHMDYAHFFTGDGDFVPVINEVKRYGINVFISAFSEGLNEELRRCADQFFNLDPIYFKS